MSGLTGPRDATRIKELASDALASYDAVTGKPSMRIVDANLKEIIKIADSMDARTGRKDPTWWQRVQERFR